MNDHLPEPDVAPVEYEIAGSSEHSGAYVPENILVDKPRDQGSRWSGAIATSNTKQWIRLRLKQVCVLSEQTQCSLIMYYLRLTARKQRVSLSGK